MTQLNEDLKLKEVCMFFPKSRFVLEKYGISDEMEHVSLRHICDVYEIDIEEFIEEIRSLGEEWREAK